MIDPHTWAWPQWTVVALMALGLLLAAVLHGKDRTGKTSFPVIFVRYLLTVFLLAMGGFFGARL